MTLPTTEIDALEALLARMQDGDRPLPWVVHSGSSYRRIASETTRENPRSFADGNVLHGVVDRHDGHHDLSMPENQIVALVAAINALPALIATARENVWLRDALKRIVTDFENDFRIEGAIVDEPDPLLVLNYRRAIDALLAERPAK